MSGYIKKDGSLVKPPSTTIVAGDVSIAKNARVDDFCLLDGNRGSIEIMPYCHIGAFTSIVGGDFTMHSFSGLSMGVRVFCANDDHRTHLMNPCVPDFARDVKRARVIIERYATVGANSVIMPGVTIGEGAIVGANSLVKTDLEPWTIYAGNPVRAIGKRNAISVRAWAAEVLKQASEK